MRLLIGKQGLIQTGDVEVALRCSAPTARAILETLDKLQLGRFENPGAPVAGSFFLADSLKWLLPAIESELTPCDGNGRGYLTDERIAAIGTMRHDELQKLEDVT